MADFLRRAGGSMLESTGSHGLGLGIKQLAFFNTSGFHIFFVVVYLASAILHYSFNKASSGTNTEQQSVCGSVSVNLIASGVLL